MESFLNKIESGESILFSEILEKIPTDDDLPKLFPNDYNPEISSISHFGLEVLKLRLEGLNQLEITEKLQTTSGRVAYWSSLVVNCLRRGDMIENIKVDIPALQRLLHMRVTGNGEYTKLSELLRDMPSDEELHRLDVERGNLIKPRTRSRINHQDLYILQQRLAGRTYGSIGNELGMTGEKVRRQVGNTRRRLIRDLRVELDVPGLFGQT